MTFLSTPSLFQGEGLVRVEAWAVFITSTGEYRMKERSLLTTQKPPQNCSGTVRWTSQSFLLLLPFLILITPFLVFLNHHFYGLFHWEVAIGMMGIAGIAVLCSVGMMIGGFVVQNFILFSLIMFFINAKTERLMVRSLISPWSRPTIRETTRR